MNITDGKREAYQGPTAWFVEPEAWMSIDRDSRRKVYDRLRKASYRRFLVNLDYRYVQHKAYVEGVRDALNELPYG